MTDKDSYLAGDPAQKAGPLSGQAAFGAKQAGLGAPQQPQHSSAPQKSRLILPTAIWILVVVAGLSFLSLLSSLNKTISTLDTLVELEQANAKLAELHHRASQQKLEHIQHQHQQHHQNQHQLQPQPMELFGNPADQRNWFAMPSWSSLEPASRPLGLHSFLSELGGLREPVITGGPSLLLGSLSQSSPGPLDSLLSTLFGAKPETTSQPLRTEPQPSLITANIGHINVNVGAETKPVSSGNLDRIRPPPDSDRNLETLMNSLVNEAELPVLEHRQHKHRHHHHKHHEQPLTDAQSSIPDVIVSVSDSGPINLEPFSGPKRLPGSPLSPYELINSNVPLNGAKVQEVPSEELQSLAESMFQTLNSLTSSEQLGSQSTHSQHHNKPDLFDENQAVVMLNGEPLIPEKKQSLASDKQDFSIIKANSKPDSLEVDLKPSRDNPLRFLFESLLGPPPSTAPPAKDASSASASPEQDLSTLSLKDFLPLEQLTNNESDILAQSVSLPTPVGIVDELSIKTTSSPTPSKEIFGLDDIVSKIFPPNGAQNEPKKNGTELESNHQKVLGRHLVRFVRQAEPAHPVAQPGGSPADKCSPSFMPRLLYRLNLIALPCSVETTTLPSTTTLAVASSTSGGQTSTIASGSLEGSSSTPPTSDLLTSSSPPKSEPPRTAAIEQVAHGSVPETTEAKSSTTIYPTNSNPDSNSSTQLPIQNNPVSTSTSSSTSTSAS